MSSNKIEISLLIEKLKKAEILVKENNRNDWSEAIQKSCSFLLQNDFTRLDNLYAIFAPTCHWDNLIANFKNINIDEAIKIGEEVFQEIIKLKESFNKDSI